MHILNVLLVFSLLQGQLCGCRALQDGRCLCFLPFERPPGHSKCHSSLWSGAPPSSPFWRGGHCRQMRNLASNTREQIGVRNVRAIGNRRESGCKAGGLVSVIIIDQHSRY